MSLKVQTISLHVGVNRLLYTCGDDNMKNIEHTDIINKKKYLVPVDKKLLLEVYKNRYAIIFALVVLFRVWIKSLPILIGFGVVFGAFIEYNYRNNFLKKLTQVPVKEASEPKNINKQALIMNVILYAIFASALLYFALTEVTDYTKYLFIIISIFAYSLSIRYFFEIKNK